MSQERIDKFLSNAQIASRSEVKKYIKAGKIRVNGVIIQKPEEKIDSEKDVVEFDDKVVNRKTDIFILLNKPAGVVTATTDRFDKTVMDLLQVPGKEKLFPVGRLDKDTEGLLIITDDGDTAHRLLSPKHHVPKTYYAKIAGIVTQNDCAAFQEGLDIGDEKKTLPARLRVLSVDEQAQTSEIEVTVCEGRFHQVKRMFQAVGKNVVFLKRISMGNLQLGTDLEPGEYRELTKEEIMLLKENKWEDIL